MSRTSERGAELDVAIVGAGAAGLTAARALSRAGLRVAIFEARDRAGGRMHSRDDVAAGAPIEFGPEFVHGSPQVTLDLLRESGDAIVDNGETAFVRSPSGLEEATHDRFDDAENVLRAATQLAQDCSIDAYLETQRRAGAKERVLEQTRALIAGFDAADPARASAKAIAEEWSGDASADGSQSRPVRGYAHLIAYMLRALDPRFASVNFSSVVSRVKWSPERVELDVRSLGHGRLVTARAAIVTVPLGVLKAHPGEDGALALEPPIPQSHARALAHLEMGPVRKVVLQFATAFWETLENGRYRDGAFFSTSGKFPTVWTQVPVRARTLTAWAGGPAADALASLDRDAAIAAALDTVVDVFDAPQAREQFVHGYDHDWQNDPFSRGAYSYALVDAGDARAELARPIGERLFIAGEATARGAEGGTVAGAIESGAHAAQTLLQLLR